MTVISVVNYFVKSVQPPHVYHTILCSFLSVYTTSLVLRDLLRNQTDLSNTPTCPTTTVSHLHQMDQETQKPEEGGLFCPRWLPWHIHPKWDGPSWVGHGITSHPRHTSQDTTLHPKRTWKRWICLLPRDTSFLTVSKGDECWWGVRDVNKIYLWDSMKDQDRRVGFHQLLFLDKNTTEGNGHKMS